MPADAREPGTSMRVLIVGAGIGGLTAAIALRQVGIDAVVLEQASELREVGAGISLWPNAIKALRRLGVGEAIESAGATVTDGDIRDWRGALLHGSSADQLEARFGAPLIMIHRAALHTTLKEALADEAVRLDTKCVGLDQNGDGVRVRLAGGASEKSDVVIGADGLNSVVRARTRADGPPERSGVRAWRAVVSLDERLAKQLVVGEFWGQGSLFGVQRLPGNAVYWYAATRVDEGNPTSSGTEKGDLLHRFGAWHAPIPGLIKATPDQALLSHDLCDRPAPQGLAFGRVALLGDAAHPMLPSLGQGACQAIEDGAALADALAATTDPELGLRAYSQRRLSSAAAAVTQSRRMSQIAHLRNPIAVALRNTLLRMTPTETSMKRLGPIVSGDSGASDEPVHPGSPS